MNFVAAIGRVMLNFLEATGRLAIFTGISVSHIVRPPFYPRLLLRQVIEIGYYSLPVREVRKMKVTRALSRHTRENGITPPNCLKIMRSTNN